MGRCSCGREATANGRECPTHFRERLRTVGLGSSVLETRSKRSYWDSHALDETFGPDRVDRYWEETNGHGSLHKAPDGAYYHENFRGERLRADDKVFADLLDGPEVPDDER